MADGDAHGQFAGVVVVEFDKLRPFDIPGKNRIPASLRIAAQDDMDIELIGEEVGNTVVGLIAACHDLADGLPLPPGIEMMLGMPGPADGLILKTGDIAC